jgi:hypothetical protein
MGQMGTWERLLTLLFLLTAVSADLEQTVNLPYEGRPVCPTIGTTTSSTRLQSSDPVKSFNEISGLALSPVQTGELVTSRTSGLQCERVMLIVTPEAPLSCAYLERDTRSLTSIVLLTNHLHLINSAQWRTNALWS